MTRSRVGDSSSSMLGKRPTESRNTLSVSSSLTVETSPTNTSSLSAQNACQTPARDALARFQTDPCACRKITLPAVRLDPHRLPSIDASDGIGPKKLQGERSATPVDDVLGLEV